VEARFAAITIVRLGRAGRTPVAKTPFASKGIRATANISEGSLVAQAAFARGPIRRRHRRSRRNHRLTPALSLSIAATFLANLALRRSIFARLGTRPLGMGLIRANAARRAFFRRPRPRTDAMTEPTAPVACAAMGIAAHQV